MTTTTRTFVVAPGCEAGLLRNQQYLAYDEEQHRFYPSPREDAARDVRVAEALKTHLWQINKTGGEMTAEIRRLNCCAARFLNAQRAHFANELRAGLAMCKDSPHLMNLVTIDRCVVAIKYKALSREQLDKIELPVIRSSYKTEAAREMFTKWMSDQLTYRAMRERGRGRQPKHPEFHDERVLDPTEGARAFARHPTEVDFVRHHHLEKQVGTRRGHELKVDPETKHLKILYDGQYRPVAEIESTHISERERLYVQGAQGRQRVFYKDRVGLTVCDGSSTEKEDPEYFSQTIPLFERKELRKHQDHRLEIWTVIKSEGEQQAKHSWIGLKTPNGEVRRLGFFWREGDEPPWLGLLRASPGDFHADGDRYNHMRGYEPYMKRTSFVITEDQYQRAYDFALQWQRQEPREFNLINYNCTDFTNGVLQAALGIQAPVQCSLVQIYLGVDLKNNFFVRYVPPIRLMVFALCFVVSILRNLLMLTIGATFWGPEHTRVFHSFFDIFNPYAGLASHPFKMREWQERIDRARAVRIQTVIDEYDLRSEGRPNELASINDQKARAIYEIKTSVPQEAIPQERSFWWKLVDLFFSLSDEDSVIPVP